MIDIVSESGYYIRRIPLEDHADKRVFGLFAGDCLIGVWGSINGPFDRLDELIIDNQHEITERQEV